MVILDAEFLVILDFTTTGSIITIMIKIRFLVKRSELTNNIHVSLFEEVLQMLDLIFTAALLICFGIVFLIVKWCDKQISR